MQERESLDTFFPTGQEQAPPWVKKAKNVENLALCDVGNNG